MGQTFHSINHENKFSLNITHFSISTESNEYEFVKKYFIFNLIKFIIPFLPIQESRRLLWRL